MALDAVDSRNVYVYQPLSELSLNNSFSSGIDFENSGSSKTYTPLFNFSNSFSYNFSDFYGSSYDFDDSGYEYFSLGSSPTTSYTPDFSDNSTFTYNPNIGSGLSPLPLNFGLLTLPRLQNTNVSTGSNNMPTASAASSSQSSSSPSNVTASKKTRGVRTTGYWASLGYNPQKGQRLAREARRGIATSFTGYCARYTKNAIARAGLGSYQYNVNGCDMARAYGNNGNFKVISGAGVDLKTVPAGCVLVYEAGKSDHHPIYGHTGVAQVDGTECSDYITRYPKECSYILVPV